MITLLTTLLSLIAFAAIFTVVALWAAADTLRPAAYYPAPTSARPGSLVLPRR